MAEAVMAVGREAGTAAERAAAMAAAAMAATEMVAT
jgi:hypothetical protein